MAVACPNGGGRNQDHDFPSLIAALLHIPMKNLTWMNLALPRIGCQGKRTSVPWSTEVNSRLTI